jgi:hypothetical protein
VEGRQVNPRVSQFVMSLVEQIDKKGVSPQHRSIIDRCTAQVYREGKETGIVPTLTTLREKLLVQPEPEAKEIALALELYTTGSLNIFGHGSNVDLDKRVVVFNIHDLGEQLKPAGLLVITDTMLNRVTLNWQKGKRTHVFIDEYHIVFDTEQGGRQLLYLRLAAIQKARGTPDRHHPERGIYSGFRTGQHHALQLRVYHHVQPSSPRPGEAGKPAEHLKGTDELRYQRGGWLRPDPLWALPGSLRQPFPQEHEAL